MKYNKIIDLPSQYWGLVNKQITPFHSNTAKYQYMLVQLFLHEKNSVIAQLYKDELLFTDTLSWKDYKSFNQDTIAKIKRDYKLLKKDT